MPKIETIEVTIQGKPELNGLIYKPVKEGKYPAILFCHGLASCKEEFADVPKIIAEKGYVCMTFDYSGHGKSKGTIGYFTDTGHFSDTKRAVEFFKNQSFVIKEKLHILGHSLGTVAILRYLGETNDSDVASIILAAPIKRLSLNISFHEHFLYWLISGIAKPIFDIFGFHIYIPYTVKPEDIYIDKDAIARAKKQKILLDYISANNYEYLIKKIDNVEYAKKINTPAMVIVGEKDKLILNSQSKDVYDALAGTMKKWKVFNNSGHSLLGDQEKEKVIETILEWLEQD